MIEQVKFLEVGGLLPSILGMRLPTQSKNDSFIDINGDFILGYKDAKLAKLLLNNGDTHGKFQRSIIVWLDITLSRKIWSELDTYTVGVTPTSSTSTMYTLKKELKNLDNLEDYFDNFTHQRVINTFKDNINYFIKQYGSINNIPKDVLKSALPDGWLQRRIKSFSYQSLRRLYLQRKDHELNAWHYMCDIIETLPYADELIFGK